MRQTQLPITALHAFSKLNDITFQGVEVQDLGPKGFGLAAERPIGSETAAEAPSLLNIPHDLILCAETIEEYSKVDQHFHQLLNAAGGKSLRGDVLLFLLMQITIASPHHGHSVGLSNPWTEYVKMLPNEVPVPTMWTEEERDLILLGTSLESALNAKMVALSQEFETLYEKTAGISWCKKWWWDAGALEFSDYLLVDAWYRSRCLELPISGESMIPCLDMANHSHEANAFYDETSDGVSLLLRPGLGLDPGSEATISYGGSKSQAEMLFSYGFIDEKSAVREMVLTLEPSLDDPLGKAKRAVFNGPPIIRISDREGAITWDSPFLYLLALNEEDGLAFGTLQQIDGSCSSLRVFWQGSDVTETADKFETLVADHELKDIFRLRVVVLLQDRIRQQFERLSMSDDTAQTEITRPFVTPAQDSALKLRDTEAAILERAFAAGDLQKKKLLESEDVLRYLGSANHVDPEKPEQQELDGNGEDDFS